MHCSICDMHERLLQQLYTAGTQPVLVLLTCARMQYTNSFIC